MIDNAFSMTNRSHSADVKKRRITLIDFRKWKPLLAAACLVGAFIYGTELLISNFFSDANQKALFIEGQYNRNNGNLVTQKSRSAVPVPKDTLLMEKSTKMIIERGSSVSELTRKDSLVVLTVSQGTIDFSVEKKRYRSFIVVTPFAKIIVTGTAFRVTSGDNFTYLKVTEGSVRVEHAVKNLRRNVVAGDELVANADELIELMVDSSAILSSSKQTVADYLKLNPAEYFVDAADSLSVIYRGLLEKIKAGKPIEETFICKFINDNPGKPWLKSLYIELSERYEKDGNLKRSIEMLDSIINSNMPQIYKDESCCRKFVLLSKENECENALSLSYSYLNDFPQGCKRNEIALLALRLSLSKSLNSGKVYNHLMSLDPPLTNMDILTSEYADSLRMAGTEPDSLLSLYEAVVEKYPHSIKLPDAAYWAAWCLVQKSINKQKKHVFTNRGRFRKRKKSYVKGLKLALTV
jgi:tetratricopeptide (TPR) repeat protein